MKSHPEIDFKDHDSLEKKLKSFELERDGGKVTFDFLSIGRISMISHQRGMGSRLLVENDMSGEGTDQSVNSQSADSQGNDTSDSNSKGSSNTDSGASGSKNEGSSDISNSDSSNSGNGGIDSQSGSATGDKEGEVSEDSSDVRALDDPSFTYTYESGYLNKIPVELTFYDGRYTDDHYMKLIFFINFKQKKVESNPETPKTSETTENSKTNDTNTNEKESQSETQKDNTSTPNSESQTPKPAPLGAPSSPSDDSENYLLDISTAVVTPVIKGNSKNALVSPRLIDIHNYFHCHLQGHFKFNPKVFKQNGESNSAVNYLDSLKLISEKEIVSFDLFSPADSCNFHIKGGFRYTRYNFVLQCLLFTVFALFCVGSIMVSGAKLAIAIVRDHPKAKNYSLVSLSFVCVADAVFAFFFIRAGRLFSF